ncbi:MAG: molybdate ABC transporter substrate-binding protein [Paracoccaceae bacterium]
MSKPIRRRCAAGAAALALSAAAVPATAETVTVFAASSLTDALAEIETGFEAATGHELVVAHAGSSALARQIRRGAPADVFISADRGWMDALEAEGLVEPGTRFDLLRNSLVLIAHDADAAPVEIGPDTDLAGLLGEGRLAMALVDAVPAGLYGRAALESLGLWDDVEARVAQTGSVRGALALVALGETPYGVVYATDAQAEAGVAVVGAIPAGTHPEIVYPAAGVAGRTGPGAEAFLSHLRGPEAREVFEAEGFGAPDG